MWIVIKHRGFASQHNANRNLIELDTVRCGGEGVAKDSPPLHRLPPKKCPEGPKRWSNPTSKPSGTRYQPRGYQEKVRAMSAQLPKPVPHDEILGRLDKLERTSRILWWVLSFYIILATLFIYATQ